MGRQSASRAGPFALALVLFIVTACSAASVGEVGVEEPAPLPAEPVEADPTQTEEPLPLQTSPEALSVTEEPPAGDQAAEAEAGTPIHRAAPAPPDVFVSDSPEFVGTTGRPQLVEFFTDW